MRPKRRQSSYNGDVVVIVDGNQLAQLQVTGLGSSLGGDTLHSTSITEVGVGEVVEELKIGLVEAGSVVSFSHGETDSVGEALAERAGGDLNSGGVMLRND